MNIEPNSARRFLALFDGLKRNYGTYDVTGEPDERGKRKGEVRTIHQPLTEDIVAQHLNGVRSIGIVPIRDDNTVRFGAIDIDLYDERLNHVQLAQLLLRENLPLIPCRTKSGGLHLYLFTLEDVLAATMRRKLTGVAALIGHG